MAYADTMSLALEARDLQLSFGAKPALDGLSLTAEAGKVTALLGPNGAGKTTFILCYAARSSLPTRDR